MDNYDNGYDCRYDAIEKELEEHGDTVFESRFGKDTAAYENAYPSDGLAANYPEPGRTYTEEELDYIFGPVSG